MHWLEKWRKDHQMSREIFAQQVNVSEELIWILENMEKGVTHPKIADAIADYTGATPQQRDSIVHKKHHGTYKPNPRAKSWEKQQKKIAVRKKPPESENKQKRPVVALNEAGVIVGKYPSVNAAVEANFPCSQESVRNRCTRRLKPSTNEFMPYGVTFRYADEWDMMPELLREDDMKRAEGTKKTYGRQSRKVI